MADSSGALLLRSGIVKPEQLAEAHRVKQRDGGSFGEALIRIGAIDEEKLVEFYHKRLMIPRLEGARLQSVSPGVLNLVQPDMAAEFRVVPVEMDTDGAVVLAMADPSDNHAVDEVAFFADRFVVRAVASETVIREAIERFYRVRITSPPTSARTHAPERPPLKAPPPIVHRPAPAPTPAPPPKPTIAELDEQIVLLTKVKRSEETPLPIPVPPPDDYVPQYAPPDEPILLTKPKDRERRDTLPGLTRPVPDPPLAVLKVTAHRDDIANVLLDYIAQLTKRSILFVVKKDLLVGQHARGEDPNVVSEMGIDISAPSIFRDVIASQLPYRGPLPATPANRAFAMALGGVGSEVVIMPITVRSRIIAVLFADQATQPLPDAALLATTREAGIAYERLILEQKGRGR
jgi:MshEN domain